jgi:hypothetical protein
MKNLIIVGNGFDLAHNLKTSYDDFKNELTDYPEEYDDLNSKKSILLQSLLKDKENVLWSDIESTYFDILINLKDERKLQDKYGAQFRYRNSRDFNNDFELIKKHLISYLIKKEESFEPIENYKNFFKEFQNKDTVIVNFNYTNTVSQYIKDLDIEIIHIHGELNNENNPIIFGFAANQAESKNLLIENDNNHVRNIKKFNYLLTNNKNELDNHLSSKGYNVFILGHSCGISDNLILNEIFTHKEIHKIIPFYYNSRDGYFDTMVNIDRIIDDYSKEESNYFDKLLSYPQSYKMPQLKTDENLIKYLKHTLNETDPSTFPILSFI